MIEALIFDFDGLILETEEPDYESWRLLYERHGARLELAQWLPFIGTAEISFDPYAELERQLGRPIDRATVRDERRRDYLTMVEAQPLLPGVTDYIQTAQRLGLKLAVASSATRDWVVGHLSRHGLLNEFASILTANDVSRTKPHPDLYQRSLAALGVPAAQAIAFEDSQNGIAAAKAADLFCVAVPNAMTRHLSLAAADLQLSALAELPLTALLERLARRP